LFRLAAFGKVWQARGGLVDGGTFVNRLNEFLQVSDAAEYLGVSPNTLRNWENAGKIVAHRHPVNGYRLFKQEELDSLLESAQNPTGDVARKTRKPK